MRTSIFMSALVLAQAVNLETVQTSNLGVWVIGFAVMDIVDFIKNL